MSWTYSLLQFIAQMHPWPYWWSRGSGAVRPRSEGRGAGAQLWRAVLAKPQPPGRFNYWWQEVMLSRKRGIAFQSFNSWQQLSPSREGEQAFIPKAKTAAGSCSPSACGAPVAAGSGGCMKTSASETTSDDTGLGIPMETFSLGAHDRPSPAWWRTC